MKTFQHLLFASIMLLAISMACNKDNCDIACLNGGECEDGNCNCPDGYTGPDCGEQATPNDVYIHAVRVTKFPALSNGSNWDGPDGTEPDIYFLVYEGNNVLYEQSDFIENADSSQEYDLTVTSPIRMANVIGQHGIQLLDYDHEINPDDIMGVLLFMPYSSSTNGFPMTIVLESSNLSFELTVTYEW